MRGWVGPTITLFYITTSRTGGFARKLDVEKGEPLIEKMLVHKTVISA